MPEFVSGDRRLHYRQQGRGRTLVILTGNTSSSAMQQGELAHFGRDHHAVALDYWGTGRSERASVWPDDWWEIAARDAVALLDHLQSERATLVGSSGGGVVGLVAAGLAPGRVEAVVADSCVPRLPPDWVLKVLAARETPSRGAAAFWRQAHGEDWAEVVAADSDLMRRSAAAGGVDVLQGRLERVKCPVLFTASLRDEILPDLEAQLLEMVRATAGSRLVLCDRGTHPLMWSRPDEFRWAADCFLAATDAR
jgi:valacyclovir hydrolase